VNERPTCEVRWAGSRPCCYRRAGLSGARRCEGRVSPGHPESLHSPRQATIPENPRVVLNPLSQKKRAPELDLVLGSC
jgi:hypothetical protein